MIMKMTGNNFVRCQDGSRKYYRAILDIYGGMVRMSRKRFGRARDAAEYSRRTISRLMQLRQHSH